MTEKYIEVLIELDDELYANGSKEFSCYAKRFDSSCVAWTKNVEENMFYLMAMQDTANSMLRSRGYIFLNEVYDMLGMARTKAGQVVGWIFDPGNAFIDSYVDFQLGVDDDLTDGIMVDFNVDGCILNILKES